MASTPVDIFIHDTYFIVAHIHYVLFGGSIFGDLRGDLLLVPEDVRPDDERDARARSTSGSRSSSSTCTFFPMHILGVGGHMRRIYNPMQYEFLQPLQHWNVFITIGALCLGRVAARLRRQLLLEPVRRQEGARRTRGTRTRSSGRRRRRRRTATSRARSRPSTAGRTSTASPLVDGGLPAAGAAARAAGGASGGALSAMRDPSRRASRPGARRRTCDASRACASGAADYVALTKPRVVLMVLVTTLVGYYLGTGGHARRACCCCTRCSARRSPPAARWRSTSTSSATSTPAWSAPATVRCPTAACCRSRRSSLGARAARRPASPTSQLAVNALAALVTTAIIAATYLLLYTPLKPRHVALLARRRRPRRAAAGRRLGRGARRRSASRRWVLFAIMFLWQIPHSLAIGRIYRDDYARAGIRVLPVVDRDGSSTATHAVVQLPRAPAGGAPADARSGSPGRLLRGRARARARLPVVARSASRARARWATRGACCSRRWSTCRCSSPPWRSTSSRSHHDARGTLAMPADGPLDRPSAREPRGQQHAARDVDRHRRRVACSSPA